MPHEPRELLVDYYDKILVQHDTPAALRLWTDATVIHYPGRHMFSGIHVGVGWLSRVYRPTLAAHGANMVKERLLSPIVGDERYALSHYHERVSIAATGAELLMARRCLYEFSDGRIVSVRIFDETPDEVDRFFTTHFPGALQDPLSPASD